MMRAVETSLDAGDVVEPIGRILLRLTKLRPDQLEACLSEQTENGTDRRIGRILRDRDCVTDRDLARALAEQWRMPYIETLAEESMDKGLVQRLSVGFLKKHHLLPFKQEQGGVGLAVTDPLDVMAIDAAQQALGGLCVLVVCQESVIQQALSQYFYQDNTSDSETLDALESEDGLDFRFADSETEDLLESAGSAPVIRLVNTILFQASRARASDIHIEP
ncbi:hypothetical protein ACFL3F_05580, partial [Planctomycetota bacterium]